MMKRLFIITVLLLGIQVAFSQQKSDKENEAAPRTALLEAQKEYRKAVKEKNSPLLIQSLIRQFKYQSLIDRDSIPSMLQHIEKHIEADQHVVEKSILHSLIAELYQIYYWSQQSKLYNRTPITGYIPRNMMEWTENIYIEKIFQHAIAAVEAQPQLAEVNCLAYQEILILGKNSPALRPTLYDFLVYRSIDILKNLHKALPYHKQTPVTDTRLFAPVADFVKMTIDVKPFDIYSNTIRLYQSLLQSELAAKRTDAVLVSDLDRLACIHDIIQTDDRDSLYTRALEQLARQNNKTPYQVEVLYQLARVYYAQRRVKYIDHNTTAKTGYEKAVDLCNKGIRQYPNYFRINILKQMLQEIKRINISYTIKPNVYPGHDQDVLLSFKNLSEISLTLYKVNETMLEDLDLDKKTPKREKISTHTYRLPKEYYTQDTVLRIPVTNTGRYQLIISYGSEKQSADSSYFSSSRLSTIAGKTGEESYNVLVCDLISGKPIPGAKVKTYRKNGRKYVPDTEFTSDASGIASIKNLPKDCLFQVTLGDDAHGIVAHLPAQYFNSSTPAMKDDINLFTDRGIYRPGQIIYFSGISWEATPEASKAVAGKKYTVTLWDANNQVVAKEELQTNEFGSFAGKFTLPRDVLNGFFFLSAGEARHPITVAEYKRPKLEILFNPIKEAYKSGARLTVSGVAKNYSGVTAGSSKVTYSIKCFSFAQRFQQDNTIAAGKTQTNEKGEFSLSFDTDKITDHSPEAFYRNAATYLVSVTVTAPNGETQESSYSIQVTPQRYQLSFSTPPYLNKEKTSSISITTQNLNGYPLTRNITYELFALKPLQQLGEEYDRRNLPVDKKVLEGTFTTHNDKPLELNLSSLPSGVYMLKISGTGEDKNITDKEIIYLYSPQDKRPPYLTYFWSIEEKTTCTPGEDAKILLGSSAEEVHVLYEIYSGQKLMERKRVMLNNSNTTLSIPYKENFDKTADVIVSFIKDGKFFTNNFTLTREEADHKLDIITKTFRDHLIPGEEEEWSFIIKNSEGKPVMAEMMAGMYDASLDKIRPNTWRFNPVYYQYNRTPEWNFYNYPLRGGIWQYLKQIDIPNFEFDRLNLYKLNPYTADAYDEVVITEYRESRGQTPVALGSVMANQDDTKFYIRGISSFKTSADSDSAGTLSEANDGDAASKIRQNFQETAFFYPQLLTDSTGNVVIKFTVPESTTTWKFMALAHTPTMQFGRIEKSVVARKEFMVSTNLPRFVRAGDKVVLQATINNLTAEARQGEAYLELFVPLTDHVIRKQQVPFNVKAQENQTVRFEFTAPENTDLLGCRIVAASAHFSDGEQHVLPVVPDAAPVTQTLPIFTSKQGQQTFKLDVPKGITPYRLTLELTANPVWYAVLALPAINTPRTENVTEITASYYVSTLASAIAIANPRITDAIRAWMQQPDAALTSPLEKNQELKSILLQLSPWVNEAKNETQQMHSLGELLDINRQNYIAQQAINKLAELQNNDGGWSWFKGFYSSTFMTENVLESMARLVALNVTSHTEHVKRMQIRALGFLDKQIQTSYKHTKTAGYPEIVYLYTRSAYRDVPLTGALEAHKYYLGQLETSWTRLSLYEKALSATALYRYGKTDVAKKIIQSLKEYATTSPEMGMYWANNRSTLFTNSAIQTHVAIMTAFREIEGNSTDMERMKQWLLRQKQTQSWGSTPATVDAIYALLLTGTNQLASPEELKVKLGRKKLNATPEEATLGYIKRTFTGKEITSGMVNMTLVKEQPEVSWGGLYLQYFEKLNNIATRSGGISVRKKRFIQQEDERGERWIPLEGKELKVGDRVKIRVTVTNEQDMQFVHLKDLRAGCLEPAEQLSGNRQQGNLVYYQETTDVATNFFFDFLPKGTHVFEYDAWITQSGVYQDGIATLQCIYAPQYAANSNAGSIIVP